MPLIDMLAYLCALTFGLAALAVILGFWGGIAWGCVRVWQAWRAAGQRASIQTNREDSWK